MCKCGYEYDWRKQEEYLKRLRDEQSRNRLHEEIKRLKRIERELLYIEPCKAKAKSKR